MGIRIYGFSDDLIEIEGDLNEEFIANVDGNYLALSNGTLLRIRYDDDGEWRISILAGGGQIYHAGYVGLPNDYTDMYETSVRPIKWIVCGTQKVKNGR